MTEPRRNVTIYTDGACRGNPGPVANADLWQRLLEVLDEHAVTFAWVKGHAGLTENERCDQLATRAAQQGAQHLEIDAGYEGGSRSAGASKTAAAPGETTTTPSLKFDASPASSGKQKATEPATSQANQRDADSPPPAHSRARITQEGQPCRKCDEPVVRREPRRRFKPGQTYCYEYYFVCPSCHTMYMVDAARRPVPGSGES